MKTKEGRYINEQEYDFVLTKFPHRDWLKNERFDELFKDDFTRARLYVIGEVLVDKNLMKYESNFGWRLTGAGMYMKDNITVKGFVAERKKEVKRTLIRNITLIVGVLTLAIGILNFIFRK